MIEPSLVIETCSNPGARRTTGNRHGEGPGLRRRSSPRQLRWAIAAALIGVVASSFAASCQDACKDGLTYCNGGCYDFENDSESCSACLNYCSLGESCAHAACAVWQTDAGDTADAGMSSAAVCAACVRPQLFESSGSCAAVYQDCKADEACTAWTHCVATCFASRFAPGCIGACNDGANDGGSSDRVAAVLGCACAIVGVLTNDAGSLVTGTNPSCREPCAALCP